MQESFREPLYGPVHLPRDATADAIRKRLNKRWGQNHALSHFNEPRGDLIDGRSFIMASLAARNKHLSTYVLPILGEIAVQYAADLTLILLKLSLRASMQ